MRQVLVQIVRTGRVVYADPDTARMWVAAGYATSVGPVPLTPSRMYGTDLVETR